MKFLHKREAKPCDYAILIVFFLLIFALAIGSVLLPDRDFSENENRNLQTFPAFTWERFLDGKWMQEISSYLSDQAIFRDEMVMGHAALEKLFGKQQNGSVLAGTDGYLYDREDYPSVENLTRSLKAIDAFAAYAKEKGVDLTLALAGRKIDVELSNLPSGYGTDTQEWFWGEIEKLTGEMEHTSFINLRRALLDAASNQQLYYRTDHHWTAHGAAIGYETICKAMGLKMREASFFTYEQASREFYGTTWSNSGMFWFGPDEMLLPHFEGENKITTNVGMKELSGFYVPEKLEEKDKYSVFFGNQYGYMEIRGETERERLLVIKDSFAHAVLPMLAADYDMDVLDLRYYTYNKGSVAEILEQGNYDRVIVLCSTPLLTDPSAKENGKLPMEELTLGLNAQA